MKRVSSAAVGKGNALNNTLVFWSQGATLGPLGLLVLACVMVPAAGCRKGSSPRSGPPATPGGASAAAFGNPREERPPPPLPPVLPAPPATGPTTDRSADPTSPAAPKAPAPAFGGTLRVRLEAEPTQLNPLLDADESALMVVDGLVYEPLIDCPAPGSASGYRPRLAESWQVSADGTKIALKIRTGLHWHDGYTFSVLDVQATLEPLLTTRGNGSAVLKASLGDVATVEIAADEVVRLNLKRPSDFALRALCDIPILPEHLLRGAKSVPGTLARQPVGTGPYRFAGWERGKRLRVERWPTYWGPLARLEAITFEIDLDGADALMRTRRGELDLLPRILTAHYPEQVDATSLRGGELAVWRLASQRWVYLGVNHRRSPLGDLAFRRGLSALWDRDHLSQALHGGLARPLAAPPFADVPPPPSGRAFAAATLETAGYRDTDADGVREVGGKPIRIGLLVASGSHLAATEARAFVLEARKVGLLIDTVAVDGPALMTRVRKGDFDLALLTWQGSPNEDPGLQFATGAPFNYWGYRSTELDGLLDELRQGPDARARERLLGDVAALLARDLPVIALYRLDVPTLIARRAHGLAARGDRFDLRGAWVDP